jgi:hypothetical protein
MSLKILCVCERRELHSLLKIERKNLHASVQSERSNQPRMLNLPQWYLLQSASVASVQGLL